MEKIMALDDILALPRNIIIERAIERGMTPLGYTCSMVPRPLLSLGRLFPVRLRAPGLGGTELADAYLSSVTCSYTRSLLEFALEDRYDFLGGWVFASSCDHLRRLKDNLGYSAGPDFSHMLDIPHRGGEAALAWTVEELRGLAAALARHFNIDAGHAAMREAIRRENSLRAALRRIGELRRDGEPCFTGTDFHRLITAVQVVPIDDALELAEDFRRTMEMKGPVKKHRARVIITGGSLDDPSYTGVIESQGALVVADRYCTGSLPGLEPVDEAEDPVTAMATQVLNTNRCPRMMENFEARKNYILSLATEYRADGIIIQSIKFCDTWGVESSALVSALREEGVPVLRLEREYRQSGEGQLRTRVQAFIESMGK